MAQVTASRSVDIRASVADTLAALSDYVTVRPAILPPNYQNYQVISGGVGAGTEASWVLQATKKRSRNVDASVAVAGTSITETDKNSTLVTSYEVTPNGDGATVTTTSSWQGAGGIGGFFEKTFAPKGLGRIQDALLANLKARLEA